MSTLQEIEAAAEALPESEQEKLFQHLAGRLLRRPVANGTKRELPLVPRTGHAITQQEIDDALDAE